MTFTKDHSINALIGSFLLVFGMVFVVYIYML